MSKHALIVDDSRLACKVLADMLEPLNISSVAVYSGEQALEYLTKQQPDIVFLDHSMKGMNGLEALQKMKRDPKTAAIPVLMYTSKQGDNYVAQAKAMGAADVLPKGEEKHYLHNELAKLGMLSDEHLATESNGRPFTVEKSIIAAEHLATQLDSSQSQQPAISDSDNADKDEFWLKNVEPYLDKQSAKQTEELLAFSKRQTRYLTQQTHKMLESFEHALVLRLESHDDFIESQRELRAQNRSRWLVAGFIVIFLIQVVLIWQFFQLKRTNQALIAAVQSGNTQGEEQAEISDQITQLQRQIATLEQSPKALPAKPTTPQILLQNGQNETVAEIFPSNSNQAQYRGVTTTGYQFFANNQGQITMPASGQFFLAENCQGDVFVSAPPARLFQQLDGSLWFVDKTAEPLEVNAVSKLAANGDCEVVTGGLLALRRLQRNVSSETGMDEQDVLQLVFN